MPEFELSSLYQDPKRIVVTAHRGFSGQYPENTMPAFREAIKLGVDIIEFDLRGTRDHIPVILHDATLERTSNATGSPHDYALHELKRLNFSYWQGTHNSGLRLSEPAFPDVTISTFEQLLDEVHGRVGLNIQVYETDAPLLSEVCRLYDAYDLYDQGYLTMSTFREAELVREVNPRIALCVLERQGQMDRESLERQKAFGCKYVQPRREDVDAAFCRWVEELGLYANMFYSNTDEDNRKYIGYGLQGILTDRPDILLRTIRDMGLVR